MAISINFAAINVNTQYRDSSISIGENNQPGWTAHSKNNFGEGIMSGINVVNQISNIVDNDVVDAPINDQDGVPGNQNQSV